MFHTVSWTPARFASLGKGVTQIDRAPWMTRGGAPRPYSAASRSRVSPGRTRVKWTGAIVVEIASPAHRATV
jgi:hypothetical protein